MPVLIENGSFISVKWDRVDKIFYIIFLRFLGVPYAELSRLRVKPMCWVATGITKGGIIMWGWVPFL